MPSREIARYLLVTVIFMTAWRSGESVRCYVCSWSPRENQTDHCSHMHFQANMVGYVECSRGCEFVTQYDKNGNITSYFRNCANHPVASEHQCQKTSLKTLSSMVCTCNSYLCNRAALQAPPALTWTLLALAAAAATFDRFSPLSAFLVF